MAAWSLSACAIAFERFCWSLAIATVDELVFALGESARAMYDRICIINPKVQIKESTEPSEWSISTLPIGEKFFDCGTQAVIRDQIFRRELHVGLWVRIIVH